MIHGWLQCSEAPQQTALAVPRFPISARQANVLSFDALHSSETQ